MVPHSRKRLLVFGYVREYCKIKNIEFPPDDIVGLFLLWLLFTEHFDKHLSHPLMIIKSIDNETQNLSLNMEKTRTDDWYTAIGNTVIEKGEIYQWKFKTHGPLFRLTEIILGVIENDMIDSNKAIDDFTRELWNGWGLWIRAMYRYHASDFNDGIYWYAKQFKFKAGNTITMILDLSQDDGILSFDIDADLDMSKDSNKSNLSKSLYEAWITPTI